MRISVLTQGLREALEDAKDDEIHELIDELEGLDEKLRDRHEKAKEHEQDGEQVVQLYQTFISKRKHLIIQLQQQGIPIPWQLRITIQELDEMLQQPLPPSSIQQQKDSVYQSSRWLAAVFIPVIVAIVVYGCFQVNASWKGNFLDALNDLVHLQ